MKKKRRHSRREFMEGALAAGAAFAFARFARGGQNSDSSRDLGTPLVTKRIAQPDDSCYWVGYSPINDQVAFVSGMPQEAGLFISRAGQPESFDLLWQPTAGSCVIKSLAWSPNGNEIAFIVQAIDGQVTPKSDKISICVVDVTSKAMREPVIIAQSIGGENKQLVNVSYKKNLAWWNDSCVCVPDNTGGVLKFDTHTGQSETLIPAQEDMAIYNVALTRSGELRFVRIKGIERGSNSQFLLCGLAQDGTTHDYADLTQQLGKTLDARLSQDGEFVFVHIEQRDTSNQLTTWFPLQINLIYKIETRSVIGRIPVNVQQKGDMYAYIPLTVRNNNELILIEMDMLTVDGDGSQTNKLIKAVKTTL